MKTIAVVTTSRADYAVYRPIIRAIKASEKLGMLLLIAGSHPWVEFGATADYIKQDGLPDRYETIRIRAGADTPWETAVTMGETISAFANCYISWDIDLLIVLGDRYEMFAAALAAVPFRIPIGHIHGGEETLGSIDNQYRHALSKLAHLHFVAHEEYAARVAHLGEDYHRIHLVGAPGLDEMSWAVDTSLCPTAPYALVNWQPPTNRSPAAVDDELDQLMDACHEVNPYFILPNPDIGHQAVRERIVNYVEKCHHRAWFRSAVSPAQYRGLMHGAEMMIGNSSSGIIEAASFKLPVVNIGNRQRGRVRAANVIDVEPSCDAIVRGIELARGLWEMEGYGFSNPFWQGGAAQKIVEVLENLPSRERLLAKPMVDIG